SGACSSRWRSSLPYRPLSRLRLLPEGEVECLEQRPRLVVVPGGRADDHVHAPDLLDLVVRDLGENDMFLDAHGIVAVAVEGIRVEPPEVADARQGDVHQPVEELVHARLAQGHLYAERHVLANLEAGDRLARMGDDRPL